jgi:hypothetical protein
MGGVGPVGKHEARQWHRRAYAGLVRLIDLLPLSLFHLRS